MQTGENSNKSNEELREEEANREASENMDRNEELENSKFQQHQNRLTQSEDPEDDDASLLNNNEGDKSTDSVSLEDKNKRRLTDEQDQDFGSEQIKQ
ncbi:hypothetical protein [Flavobacterium cyanobacteriorum]|nr:hypothetical protein [Flavobacterium cyanobacteriorum]